jgi:O-6-methylguanine DNA methyltransferase
MKSDFKQKVLRIVAKIPKGEAMTYKELAEKAGNPKAYRAVANILAKNRNPKIPCHRVIENNNLIGGYYFFISIAGQKHWLFGCRKNENNNKKLKI